MQNALTNLQDKAIDVIAELGPWLSPIPTAVLVGRATVRHLGWESWTGWISGVIVEIVGLSTVDTTMRYYDYNQVKRKSDPAMPTWLPAVLAACYLASTVILTVLLDTMPDLSVWAPLIFPLLSLVGALNLVLRRHLRNTKNRIAEARLLAGKPSASQAQSESQSESVAPAKTQAKFICAVCGEPWETQQALAAHGRKHKRLEDRI